jgi:hypothetical protein
MRLKAEIHHAAYQMNETHDTIPVPDPTRLTTDQLRREIAAVRELVESHEAALKIQIGALRELHTERFTSIAIQFAERDKRTEQLSLADKTAIAAALQAQKEAAAAQNESSTTANVKMEAHFVKLIDQQEKSLEDGRRNTEQQIADLKSRMDKAEGHGKGIGDLWGIIVGGIGILAGIAGIVIAVMKHA